MLLILLIIFVVLAHSARTNYEFNSNGMALGLRITFKAPSFLSRTRVRPKFGFGFGYSAETDLSYGFGYGQSALEQI